MAKVMISFPDELLAEVDARARQQGTTRSGLLQELARRQFADGEDARLEKVDALLARAAGRFDGRGADHVRADRDSR